MRGTPGHGSLREWGVAYRELPLAGNGSLDWEGLAAAVTPSELLSHTYAPSLPLSRTDAQIVIGSFCSIRRCGTYLLLNCCGTCNEYCRSAILDCPNCLWAGTRVALIQRSCGYALRPTLCIGDIQRAAQIIKDQNPNCVVAVDNCYGEFTEEQEPCAVCLHSSFLRITQPLSLSSGLQQD